jgi:hypothetical protein
MINVVLLNGLREKSIGLIGMSPIPPDTFFVFNNVKPGQVFHSRGVLEPFDIAFLNEVGDPISINEIVPPDGLIAAPLGTCTAVEAKAGYLRNFRGLGHDPTPDSKNADLARRIAFPVVIMLIGSIIGYMGFQKRGTALGEVLLGAGGSVAAASVVFLIHDLMKPPICLSA